MKLTYCPYNPEFKYPFTLSNHSRTYTSIILTEIEYAGFTGFGEASLPPYIKESPQESVCNFFSKVDLSKYNNTFELENILAEIESIDSGNTAAKASIDIALHDLVGKLLKKPWHKLWKLDLNKAPYTCYTIGIDSPKVVIKKVKEADKFKVLRVKLGTDKDKEIIEAIRSVTDKPLAIDVSRMGKQISCTRNDSMASGKEYYIY